MTELLKHYFDIASATPVDPSVIEAMLPYFHTHFANPNAQHQCGQEAAKAIKQSTKTIADILNIDQPVLSVQPSIISLIIKIKYSQLQ